MGRGSHRTPPPFPTFLLCSEELGRAPAAPVAERQTPAAHLELVEAAKEEAALLDLPTGGGDVVDLDERENGRSMERLLPLLPPPPGPQDPPAYRKRPQML